MGQSGKPTSDMLIGEYQHTLDGKRRVSLPVKFRSVLGSRVVLTRGLDNCIFLYSEKQWQDIADKLATLPLGQKDARDFTRFLLSSAIDVEVDKAGRILIPENHVVFAGLSSRVVLAGVYNRVEIWEPSAWEAYTKRIEDNIDSYAEELGQIGMI